MLEVRKSFCRVCLNACPIEVTLDDGRVTQVKGDPENTLFGGYTCIKGRAQGSYLNHPERLRHSLKRKPDGQFEKIATEQALDEIAERLSAIRANYGPRAIASYAGTMLFPAYATSMPMLTALMDTIGSPMRFDTDTIDKGGKLVALSLHGNWMAPAQCFDEPDVMMLIGINPVVTFTGLPTGNPGEWLKRQKRRGMRLIVIDPRRTQVAKRADLHLRPKPGFDVAIVACLIRCILRDQLYDRDFVADNVVGLESLRAAVEPFDPSNVSTQTGVKHEDLLAAARMFAGQRRGYVMAGTGPHMAGVGTLTEYLVLVLQTLCGYWLRAGDAVTATPSLLPQRSYKAQAQAPDQHWAFGETVGQRGLRETRAGLPIIELPEEMLRNDDNRVRAMVCVGGNPVAAIPDHHRTVEALKQLDLFVQIDPWMSRSSRLADYVLAPTMALEVAANTQVLDVLTGWTGYGLGVPYANATPAIASPPAGAELKDDWQFLHGLARRLGFDGRLPNKNGGTCTVHEQTTTESFLELMAAGARVDLDKVKASSSGGVFVEPRVTVEPRAPSWQGRFDVANTDILSDLRRHQLPAHDVSGDYPFRLICRRHMQAYNSSYHFSSTHRSKPYNPAFLSTEDMRALNLSDGDIVMLQSADGQAYAVAETDTDVPPGIVSMTFAYGDDDWSRENVREVGTDPNRLIRVGDHYDRYTGQPRMSNIPIRVEIP